jgi:hypothetical protein
MRQLAEAQSVIITSQYKPLEVIAPEEHICRAWGSEKSAAFSMATL